MGIGMPSPESWMKDMTEDKIENWYFAHPFGSSYQLYEKEIAELKDELYRYKLQCKRYEKLLRRNNVAF